MTTNQTPTGTVRKIPKYESVYDTAIERLLSEYTSRKYDPDAFYKSELYNLAKESYLQKADRAMEDTLAKTAYLTGGHNSTYSQIAGQQAYERYLREFDDYAIKLADKDYSRFLSQGDTKLKQLNAVGAQSDREYKRYQSALDYYQQQQDFAKQQDYRDKEYDFKLMELEYRKQKDERDYLQRQSQSANTTASKSTSNSKAEDKTQDKEVKESQAYKDVYTRMSSISKELKSGQKDYADIVLYLDNILDQGHITTAEADYILDLTGISRTEYKKTKETATKMAQLLAKAPAGMDMKTATELMISLGKDAGGNYHFSNIMISQAFKEAVNPRQRELAIGSLLGKAPGLSVSQRQLIKAIASGIIRG